jgi:hypothetical protein
MKKIYASLTLCLLVALVQAQIPNAGFENWTNGVPNGWFTNFSPGDTFFARSSDAHSGSYALRINAVSTGSFVSGGFLYSGDSLDYNFAVSAPPQALYGWYIGYPADTGDELTINSMSTSAGLAVGGNTVSGITEATSVYKQFIINYSSWTGSTGADSVYIEFGLQNFYSGLIGASTYFLIDDLSFGAATTGIGQLSDMAVLEQCSPNPAHSKTDIIYSISGRHTVSMDLYDVLGHKVRSLLSDTPQTEGRYKVPVDVTTLSDGVYLCTLMVDGRSFTQKLIVSK